MPKEERKEVESCLVVEDSLVGNARVTTGRNLKEWKDEMVEGARGGGGGGWAGRWEYCGVAFC